MAIFSTSRLAALAALIAAMSMSAAPAYALNIGGLHAAQHTDSTAIVKVHGRWHDDDDDDDYEHRTYRHHHRHHHDEVVDAPFTHVESGRRVIVDAPFAHVSVNRHGRHVVAPFVNLWIPRY